MQDAGRPISSKEAYELIVSRGLYTFNADNPSDVVRSQIRRHCKNFEFTTSASTKYFEEREDGKFFILAAPLKTARRGAAKDTAPSGSLREKLPSINKQLKELHYKYNEEVKCKVLKGLKALTPAGFEQFAGKLLKVYGFHDTKVTQISKDGGIDGHGKLRVGLAEMNVAFQCKRWNKNSIQRPQVDEFRGAIQGEYEQGIFFTTSTFSGGAKEVSFKRGAVPVILIDGAGIIELMFQKEFGVQKESLPVYSYALDLVFESEDEKL